MKLRIALASFAGLVVGAAGGYYYCLQEVKHQNQVFARKMQEMVKPSRSRRNIEDTMEFSNRQRVAPSPEHPSMYARQGRVTLRSVPIKRKEN